MRPATVRRQWPGQHQCDGASLILHFCEGMATTLDERDPGPLLTHDLVVDLHPIELRNWHACFQSRTAGPLEHAGASTARESARPPGSLSMLASGLSFDDPGIFVREPVRDHLDHQGEQLVVGEVRRVT